MCRKSSMEITALNQNVTFPPGTFDLPMGFVEVDFFSLMTGGKMPDLNSVPREGVNQMVERSR